MRRLFLLMSVFACMLWLSACKETSLGDDSDGQTVTSAETTAAPPDSTADRSTVTDSGEIIPPKETETERSLPTDCELATLTADGTQTETAAQTKAASNVPDGRIKVSCGGTCVKLPWDFQPLAEQSGAVSQRSYMRKLSGGETVYFIYDCWPVYFREHDDAVGLGEIADSLTEVLIALESDSWEDAQANPFSLNDAHRSNITVSGLPFVHQTGTLSRGQNTQYYYEACYGVAPITFTDDSRITKAPVRWILFTEKPDGEAEEYMHALTVQLCESFSC